MKSLIRVKTIPAGEAKYRLDLAASVYLLGVTMRLTVYTKEFSLNIGKGIGVA